MRELEIYEIHAITGGLNSGQTLNLITMGTQALINFGVHGAFKLAGSSSTGLAVSYLFIPFLQILGIGVTTEFYNKTVSPENLDK